jgi:hypothetical protein
MFVEITSGPSSISKAEMTFSERQFGLSRSIVDLLSTGQNTRFKMALRPLCCTLTDCLNTSVIQRVRRVATCESRSPTFSGLILRSFKSLSVQKSFGVVTDLRNSVFPVNWNYWCFGVPGRVRHCGGIAIPANWSTLNTLDLHILLDTIDMKSGGILLKRASFPVEAVNTLSIATASRIFPRQNIENKTLFDTTCKTLYYG